VVEKKEEKKEIKSWIVDEGDISKTFAVKFDMNKVDTEFSSLTDDKFNKELEEVSLLSSRKPRRKQKKINIKLLKRKEGSNLQFLKSLLPPTMSMRTNLILSKDQHPQSLSTRVSRLLLILTLLSSPTPTIQIMPLFRNLLSS